MKKIVLVGLFLFSSISLVQPMMRRTLVQSMLKNSLVGYGCAAHLKSSARTVSFEDRKQYGLRRQQTPELPLVPTITIGDNQVVKIALALIKELTYFVAELSAIDPSKLTPEDQAALVGVRTMLAEIEKAFEKISNTSIEHGDKISEDQEFERELTSLEQAVIVVYTAFLVSFGVYYLFIEVPNEMKNLKA